MCNLGVIYLMGEGGIDKDPMIALKYYEEAEKLNSLRATCVLGYMYEYGEGVDKNINKAIKYYTKAAENDGLASYALGNIYKTGREKPKNLKIALKYFQKAAQQTHSLSQLLAQVQIYQVNKEMKSKNYIQSRFAKFIIQEQRRKENEKKKQEEIDFIRKKNIQQKKNQLESKELLIQPFIFQPSAQEEKRELLKRNQVIEQKKQEKEEKKKNKKHENASTFSQIQIQNSFPHNSNLEEKEDTQEPPSFSFNDLNSNNQTTVRKIFCACDGSTRKNNLKLTVQEIENVLKQQQGILIEEGASHNMIRRTGESPITLVQHDGVMGVFSELCQSARKEPSLMKKGLTNADRKRRPQV